MYIDVLFASCLSARSPALCDHLVIIRGKLVGVDQH